MKFLSSCLIIIFVTVLMGYLNSASNKKPMNNENGTIILRMNKVYGIFGYIGIAFSAIIGIIASLGTVKSISDLLIAVCIVLFCLVLSSLLILAYRNQKVEFNDEVIRYTNMTGKTTEILWRDITSSKFSKTSLELKLIAGGKTIKIHMHFVGFMDLVKHIEHEKRLEVFGDALLSIKSVNKNI